MTSIDLGKKPSDGGCMPCPVSTKEPGEPYYPSLYIDGDEALADLPEEGTMLVKFKRTSVTKSERNGKTSVSVSLDILKIVSADGESEPGMKRDPAGDALDELAAKLIERMGGDDE